MTPDPFPSRVQGSSPVAAPPPQDPRSSGGRRVRRLFGWLSRPEVSVFGGLALKALGAGILLLAVTLLGERERERSLHGELRDSPPMDEPALPPEKPSAPIEGALVSGAPRASVDASGEPGETPPVPCADAGTPRPKGITDDGKVILNEATREELTTLRGVGEKRAEDIVRLRERLGRFRRVSDLLRIRGIGWKSLQKLQSEVVLDRPTPPAAPAEAESESEQEEGRADGPSQAPLPSKSPPPGDAEHGVRPAEVREQRAAPGGAPKPRAMALAREDFRAGAPGQNGPILSGAAEAD